MHASEKSKTESKKWMNAAWRKCEKMEEARP